MIGIQTCRKCGAMFVGPSCPTCVQTTLKPTMTLKPGQTLHGFEVLEPIGKGGMGAVYKARQAATGRVAALKVLSPEQSRHPEFRGRFDREAKTLSALSHPNIVACYDFGSEKAMYFLAMEFVDGFTLRDILRGRRLSVDETIRLMTQLCDGLAFAHGKGVVHRDIKPENILVDKKGVVKIADFGLVKLVDAPAAASGTSLTATGAELGTRQYMAPEQVENPKAVDQRVDVYAAGVVLYELLTGVVPAGKVEPPSRKTPVHPYLDQATMRAIAKDPALRTPSAAEFKADLLRAGGGK